MQNESLSFFKNHTVGLLGAGVSNMPLAELLVDLGAIVTVRDQATEEKLGERAEKLKKMGCRLVLGEKYLQDIDEEYLFRSPGIRPDRPELAEAVRHGCRLTSEMELFLEKCPCPVFAVSGSDGKSTTTTLISLLLKEEEKRQLKGKQVFLGGNIGEPLLHRIGQMKSTDAVAAEVSSFQLMTVHSPVYRAVITNITPNHLNWHLDMDEYIQAKAKLLDGCGAAVLNAGNEITRKLGETCSAPVTYFSRTPFDLSLLKTKDSAVTVEDGQIVYIEKEKKTPVVSLSEILLPGMHNAENYMAAIAATWGIVSKEAIRAVATSFTGVVHRLQLIRKVNGVSYYNSSIDSTPTRTLAALSAMGDRSIVLMLGGYDKHIPFAPLAEGIAARGHFRAVVVSGATAPLIMAAFQESEKMKMSGIPVFQVGSFDEAFAKAVSVAQADDCVLLSPACASFDEFVNFEKRGEHFVDLVKKL